MIEPNILLNTAYDKAMSKSSGRKDVETSLQSPVADWLDLIIRSSENSKGVLAVVITGIVYKILHPNQDVRRHQSRISEGYSGRTFDTKYITPFLKSHKFPAMAESGWLTRSLEQKVPYDTSYTGAIKPVSLKEAFINIYDKIEANPDICEELLSYILQSLIIKRDAQNVAIATPHNLSISDIIALLDTHFNHHYIAKGASRLPVLAVYASYNAMMGQMKRYEGKTLMPLAMHNSADYQSGRLGDIDVTDASGEPFEAVEIKLGIPISYQMILTAKEKIQPTKVQRYYVLSTSPILEADREMIEKEIRQIKNIHGCQLVANGVMPTLKYYLRLLNDTSDFIGNYAKLLVSDNDIKFEHRCHWNELVANL